MIGRPSNAAMGSAARLFLLTLAYLLYICFGAGVFMALERPHERGLTDEVGRQRRNFLATHECLTVDELDEFIRKVEDAWSFGVTYDLSANASLRSSTMWDFGGSFFFTTTLLTTIGYGHVSPLTWTGQLFCLFFALFGIPFTFFFLGTVTYVVGRPSLMFLDYLAEKLERRTTALIVRCTHLLVLFVLVLVFFFLVPAAVFSVLENDWNFFESFYFIFVSLTTVGLGDFVPNTAIKKDALDEGMRSVYFICVSMYLLLGLGMMFLLIDTVIKIPEIQRLWELSFLTSPSSSASTSLSSSRSSSPAPVMKREMLTRSFDLEKKSEEERQLTKAAAPMGRSNYDTMSDKENGL